MVDHDVAPIRAARMRPDMLRVHPMNLHREVGDLRELAASIREEGVHQALEVQRRGDVFEVVDGRRRLLAARQAGVRTVPVLVVPTRSDADVLATVLRTGVHKRMLSEGELRATAVMLRDQHGWSPAVIGQRIGVGVRTVQLWLADPTAPAPAAQPLPKPARRLVARVSAKQLRERLAVWDRQPPVSVPALLEELRAMVVGADG